MTTSTVLILFALSQFMHACTLWLTAKLADVNVREIHQSLEKKSCFRTFQIHEIILLSTPKCSTSELSCLSMKWPRYLTKVFVNNDDVIYRCIVHLSSWYFGPLCSTEKKREFNKSAVNGRSQSRESSLLVETHHPFEIAKQKTKGKKWIK